MPPLWQTAAGDAPVALRQCGRLNCAGGGARTREVASLAAGVLVGLGAVAVDQLLLRH